MRYLIEYKGEGSSGYERSENQVKRDERDQISTPSKGEWVDEITEPGDIATAEEVKDFYSASERELSILRSSAFASGLLKPRPSNV